MRVELKSSGEVHFEYDDLELDWQVYEQTLPFSLEAVYLVALFVSFAWCSGRYYCLTTFGYI